MVKLLFACLGAVFLLVQPAIAANHATQMIVITNTGFLPKELSFHPGEKVQMIINNTDQAVHNLVIPDLNLKSPDLMKGEMAVLNFSANKIGVLPFFSNTPGYKELNYVGSITIGE